MSLLAVSFLASIEIARKLTSKPWGGLVDVSQWQLATPDAEVLAIEFEQLCIKHNRHFVALSVVLR